MDSLHTQYRMVAFTSNDNDIAKWWLQREMLKDWAAVLTQETSPNYEDWKLHTLEDFGRGLEVGLVIDTNERVIERAAPLGIMGMQPTPAVPARVPHSRGSSQSLGIYRRLQLTRKEGLIMGLGDFLKGAGDAVKTGLTKVGDTTIDIGKDLGGSLKTLADMNIYAHDPRHWDDIARGGKAAVEFTAEHPRIAANTLEGATDVAI
jgi:hypothetical protein